MLMLLVDPFRTNYDLQVTPLVEFGKSVDREIGKATKPVPFHVSISPSKEGPKTAVL